MTTAEYWNLFARTGDPMVYVEYRTMRREEHAASDNQGAGDPRNRFR